MLSNIVALIIEIFTQMLKKTNKIHAKIEEEKMKKKRRKKLHFYQNLSLFLVKTNLHVLSKHKTKTLMS